MSIVDIKIEDGDQIAEYYQSLLTVCQQIREVYWKYVDLTEPQRYAMSRSPELAKHYVETNFDLNRCGIETKEVMFAVDIHHTDGTKRETYANASIRVTPFDYVDVDRLAHRLAERMVAIAKDHDHPENGFPCAINQLKISTVYDVNMSPYYWN